MKFYIDAGRISVQKEKELNKKGKYVADIRDRGGIGNYEYDTIEPCVIANHLASIITNEKIDFSKYENGIIFYNEFAKNNEQVESIEEL